MGSRSSTRVKRSESESRGTTVAARGAGVKPLVAILAAMAAALLVVPLLLRYVPSAGDYPVHTAIAYVMAKSVSIPVPHFLLHLLILVVSFLLHLPLDRAQLVVVTAAYAATASIVTWWLLSVIPSRAMALGLGLAAILVAPIPAFYPLDHHLYLGYIGMSVYHNPTIILLKPLALVSFAFATRVVEGDAPSGPLAWLAAGAITVASTLAKPNFTICILPALALFGGLSLVTRRHFDWRQAMLGFAVPAAIVLAFQYRMTYASGGNGGGEEQMARVIFAPLLVMKSYSSWLGAKLLLSALFPLAVLALQFRAAINDRGLRLAWVLFLIGVLYTYLLAESGPRLKDGNFGWCGQIGLFILFVQSVLFLVKTRVNLQQSSSRAERTADLVCWGALGLHVVSGIAFYAAEYAPEMFW